MNSKQFKRADFITLIVSILIYAYDILTAFFFYIKNGFNTPATIQLICGIVSFLLCIGIYYCCRGKKICGSLLCGLYALSYLVVLLTSDYLYVYLFALPLMLSNFAYLNLNITVIGNISVVLGTVLHCFLLKGKVSFGDMLVAVIIVTLCAVASIFTSFHLKRFLKEATDGIKKELENNKSISDKIIKSNNEVSEKFNIAKTLYDNIKIEMQMNNDTINNIADSTENTAEAIQQEAVICTKVNDKTDTVKIKLNTLNNVIKDIKTAIDTGLVSVNTLTLNSEKVSDSITQLKGMYPDDYEVIDANCPQLIFLGGDENSNNEYLSKKMGNTTKKGFNTNVDNKKVSGGTTSEGVELMRPEDFGRLDYSQTILFIYGEQPIMDTKFDYPKHKNYKYTYDYANDEHVEAYVFDRSALVKNKKTSSIIKTIKPKAIPQVRTFNSNAFKSIMCKFDEEEAYKAFEENSEDYLLTSGLLDDTEDVI